MTPKILVVAQTAIIVGLIVFAFYEHQNYQQAKLTFAEENVRLQQLAEEQMELAAKAAATAEQAQHHAAEAQRLALEQVRQCEASKRMH